jgi:hypothetical protein
MRGLPLLLALVFAIGPVACDGDDDDASDSAPVPGDDDSGDDTAPPVDPWSGLEPTGPPVGEFLGVSSHMDMAPGESWTRDFELEKLAAAGMKRIRRDFIWNDIEPADDEWHFERTDTFVEMAAARGFDVDVLLCYGVGWAMPGGSPSEIPPAAYAEFAGRVAARYCDRASTFEVWNEPNLGHFWPPAADPEAYGDLLAAAYPAIKAACPGATVLFGGLSSGGSSADSLWAFLEDVRRARPNIGTSFDALAIHPYTLAQQFAPEWSMGLGDLVTWPDLMGQIAIARERLAVMHDEWMPIYLTEIGWPSYFITEEDQGAFAARGALLSLAGGASGFYWYTFWDGEGTNPLPTEDRFGLFGWPFAEGGPREKPSYRAMKGLFDVLGAARYSGDLSAPLGLPDGAYALAFADGDAATEAVTLAAWDGRPERTGVDLALPPPKWATHVALRGEDGALVREDGIAGAIPLRLTPHVVYVRFER